MDIFLETQPKRDTSSGNPIGAGRVEVSIEQTKQTGLGFLLFCLSACLKILLFTFAYLRQPVRECHHVLGVQEPVLPHPRNLASVGEVGSFHLQDSYPFFRRTTRHRTTRCRATCFRFPLLAVFFHVSFQPTR